MLRIGEGYDVHRLVTGRRLVLGGVDIPYEKGLDGHSDADVLVHAIMDALLGAGSFGDIGAIFPDTDNKYLGADSLALAKKVAELLRQNNFEILNIDSTIIAQSPKIAPYVQKMRSNIANALLINPEQISVKATTEEGLGFTGEKKGIAAKAICLIEKR